MLVQNIKEIKLHESYQSILVPELEKSLDAYRDEFRKLKELYEINPSEGNLEKLSDFLYKMRGFLQENKEELFTIAHQMGWSKFAKHNSRRDEGDGYEGYFNTAMNAINTFLNPSEKHPTASLDFLNEEFTQLTWLVSTPHDLG